MPLSLSFLKQAISISLNWFTEGFIVPRSFGRNYSQRNKMKKHPQNVYADKR